MLQIYQRLEKEGKIGQYDETGRQRPRQEYPKWVRNGDGKDVVVASQREELAVASYTGGAEVTDPVVAERNRLAQENAELRAKLAAIATGGEEQNSTKAPETSKPTLGLKPK